MRTYRDNGNLYGNEHFLQTGSTVDAESSPPWCVCTQHQEFCGNTGKQEIFGRCKVILYKMAIEFLDVLCEVGNTVRKSSDEAIYPVVNRIAICNFSASL